MNHEEILEAIQLRSTIENLDADRETRDRLLAGIPNPTRIPWDLVTAAIKDREEAVTEGSLLDDMIAYYEEVLASVEWRLEDARELKDSLTSHTETATVEAWGQL